MQKYKYLNNIKSFQTILIMITLLTIIILFTVIKWIVMWDKAIKQKKHILEFFPENKLSGLFFVLTTIFTSIVALISILLYLP